MDFAAIIRFSLKVTSAQFQTRIELLMMPAVHLLDLDTKRMNKICCVFVALFIVGGDKAR
jgi:hypothetical protein